MNEEKSEVDILAKEFGAECCMNEEKTEPCINCRYKASQVIRFGYTKHPSGMVPLDRK